VLGNRKSSWLLAALSGVLQVLIFPSPGLSFLSWFALLPLLIALLPVPPKVQLLGPGQETTPSLTAGQGFWLGYLSGFIWYLGSCYWVFQVMNNYGGLSAPVAAGVLFLFCLYLAIYHGLFGALLVRISRGGVFAGARTLFLAPFLWVAIELARARITGFPWDLLGTAQVDNIPFTRIATFTGVYGLSFGIFVVNALYAGAFLSRTDRRRQLATAATIVALALQLGTLAKVPMVQTTHIARLVQQNLPISETAWTADYFDRTIAELTELSRQPKDPAIVDQQTSGERTQWSKEPRLIIWPESPAPFYSNDPKFGNWLSTLASDQDAYLIAGSLGLKNPTNGSTEYDIFNSAILVAPSGSVLARYDKLHLVPFGEYVPFQSLLFFAEKLTKQVGTFSRGTQRTVFTLSTKGTANPGEAVIQSGAPASHHHHHDGSSENEMTQQTGPAPRGTPPGEVYRLGVFICYESIFPDEIRSFALNGANVFVNISNDGWFGQSGAPGQHLNMARMRAIENHRWVLRSTNTGITASIDPLGRVVSSAPRNLRTAVNVPYAMESEITFYTRYGDWFAFACAIISLSAAFVRFSFRAGVLR
jgi:apolipoprotein N-acyltransferase